MSAMFAEWPLPQRLHVARAHGFEGVDGHLPPHPRQLRGWLDAARLQFSCLTFAQGGAGELGICALPGRQAEFRQALAQALDAATVLGCSLVHPLAGRVPPDADLESHRATYLANLRLACKAARECGLRVAIEPIAAARQPSYLLHTYAQALAWRAAVGAQNLVLILDTFHAAAAGEDTLALLRHAPHAFGMVQLADPATRREPRCDASLRALAATLQAAAWDGWISAEYEPGGATTDSLAWRDAFRTERNR